MGLFKNNWNKPGPGVPKNAPKKTGFARLFEIFGRDFMLLLKLNFLLFAILLPAAALYTLFLLFFFSGVGSTAITALVFGGLSFVACLPLGPALTAFFYILTQILRDEPGFLWHDFKRKFKENFRSMLLPGLLFGGMVGSLGFTFFYSSFSGQTMNLLFTVAYMLAAFFLILVYPYFFTQAAYIDLPNLKILQNSFFLAFANLPRSFMGALLGSGLLLLQLLFFPFSTILTFVLGLALPGLLNLMWIWPKIDQAFHIEETLKTRQEEQYSSVDSNELE